MGKYLSLQIIQYIMLKKRLKKAKSRYLCYTLIEIFCFLGVRTVASVLTPFHFGKIGEYKY